MHILIDQFGWLTGALISAFFIFFRYAIMAGFGYLIFYSWKRRRFIHRKIQQRLPSWYAVRHEIGHSLLSAAIFALVGLGIYGLKLAGWSQVYTDTSEYGALYLVFSFLVLIVVHDTYFYWMHRLMHHPRLFKLLHLVHHRSNNPTPWASLAFHPLEALIEIAIIPVLVIVMPLHPIVLFAFATWSLTWNVVGHLGFELFPAGWLDHPMLKWLNTSTHHNMHHHYSKGNYSLYFNWWDRWLGTNHPDYEATFRALTEGNDNLIVKGVREK
ncbi:sterol desaturase family protein [Lewinella cohaerens]|uniref:sterol desaturase family protein n=1 Tax=Lewinella cohaerens TaxID=70995 RepID=UPI00036D1D9B|nr:sterol desaturase family protein [Lewinella cohaerens]